MMLTTLRAQFLPALARAQLPPAAFFATGTTTTSDPLKSDTRTEKSKETAHETDEATKDSIRHASEGKIGEAIKDVGNMAKGAVKGAGASAKLMADSLKKKAKGEKTPDGDDPTKSTPGV